MGDPWSKETNDKVIERLEDDLAVALENYKTQMEVHYKDRDRIKRLEAVVDAARDFVNNHMDHDDAMRIFDALAALEGGDER